MEVDILLEVPRTYADGEGIFISRDILSCILYHITDERTSSVVGCSAWFTNRAIMTALSDKGPGLSTILCHESGFVGKKNLKVWKVAAGVNGGLMHHKFLVGLDVNRAPLWLINGSFNLTEHALFNRENIIVCYRLDTARMFLGEFDALASGLGLGPSEIHRR